MLFLVLATEFVLPAGCSTGSGGDISWSFATRPIRSTSVGFVPFFTAVFTILSCSVCFLVGCFLEQIRLPVSFLAASEALPLAYRPFTFRRCESYHQYCTIGRLVQAERLHMVGVTGSVEAFVKVSAVCFAVSTYSKSNAAAAYHLSYEMVANSDVFGAPVLSQVIR